MQLVRTITGRRERTIKRKLSEMTVALLIRRRFGAKAILDCYLSIAYVGEGVTGLDAAARKVFGRISTACSDQEKALLGAMLLRPVPRTPTFKWWAQLSCRANKAQARAMQTTTANTPRALPHSGAYDAGSAGPPITPIVAGSYLLSVARAQSQPITSSYAGRARRAWRECP